jgi:ubiquitin-like protein Pup
MSQEQKDYHAEGEEAEETPAPDPDAAEQERLAKLGEDVDGMLDEIDDILEENAEEFVESYIQKGGQ